MKNLTLRRLLLGAGALVLAAAAGDGLIAEPPDPHPGASQPVREQNLDGSGSVRVHEQGVATVNITGQPVAVTGTVEVGNSSLDVNVLGGSVDAHVTGGQVQATVPPATTAFFQEFVVAPNESQAVSFATINASAVHARSQNDSEVNVGFSSPLVPTDFHGLFSLGGTNFATLHAGELIPFTQPIPVNGVGIICLNSNSDCRVHVAVIGVPAP